MQVHFQNTPFEHDKLSFKGNSECTESITMTFFAELTQPNFVKLFSCIYTNSNAFASEKIVMPCLLLTVDQTQVVPK